MQPSLIGQTAKLQTLKTAILADPTLAALFSQGDDGFFQIAFLMNLPASPNYFIWKMQQDVSMLTSNDGFDWTRVDNLSTGKSRIWEFMGMGRGIVNFNRPNVRAGINACFSVAADSATRLAIFTEAQVLATRAEKLFAGLPGTGASTNDAGVGPATTTEIGALESSEIQNAHDLP